MLVELGEVEQFLADALAVDALAGARLPSLRLVHVSKVLDLRLGAFQLGSEVLDAVVILLLLAADHANEAAVLTAEDDHGALLLMLEQLIVGEDLLTAFLGVNAFELQLR